GPLRDEDLGQVEPRHPLEARIALASSGFDRLALESLRLGELWPVPEDASEVVLDRGGEIEEPHPVAGAQRLPQRGLGALKVAELGVEVAEVGADGASIAQVARLLEGLQGRLETAETPPEIAGHGGAYGPQLMQKAQRLRVERRVALAGQRTDGGDQRIRDRVAPTEEQEVGSHGQGDDPRAPDGRVGGQRRSFDEPDLVLDGLQPPEFASGDDGLGERSQPGRAPGG